jgi:signal transduction histidine kinase
MKRSDLENYVQAAQTSTVMILRNLQRVAAQIQSFKQVAVDQTSSEKRLFKLKSYIDNLLVNILPKLKEAQHTINVHCPRDIEIISYPGAFSQIITHFVMNTLTHGFEHKTRGEIVLDITREENVLQIQYCDNGRGMTKEERSRIFDAFYTTRRGQRGTGLGLHIVYNLITQQLGGDITCKSSPGVGTTFIICIPLESD